MLIDLMWWKFLHFFLKFSIFWKIIFSDQARNIVYWKLETTASIVLIAWYITTTEFYIYNIQLTRI